MITCTLRYRIDPYKLADFETYARMWLPLVTRLGGVHHGYFLPHEGPNDVAYALFSFDSLAAYESYRRVSADDPECIAAYEHAERTRCIVSHERSFTRPVLGNDVADRRQGTGTDGPSKDRDGDPADHERADVIDIDEGRNH